MSESMYPVRPLADHSYGQSGRPSRRETCGHGSRLRLWAGFWVDRGQVVWCDKFMRDAEAPQPTDETLMQRICDGDRTAADALTRRYWDAIQRYCVSYLHEAALADEVAQETFAKLSSAEHPPQGAVRPWLYRVARNRCLDILRRFQRSPTHHKRINTGFEAARDSAGPRTQAARRERQVLIRNLIDAMPEPLRSVLILKYYEDFSRAEMAEALDISEAAVKGRLVRATRELEEQLRRITGSWT